MKYLFRYILTFTAAALLCTACSESDEFQAPKGGPIPEGYGRLTLNVGTPETFATRAVNEETPWLEGTAEERAIKSYYLLICDGQNIVQAISGALAEGTHQGAPDNYYLEGTPIQSKVLPVGEYTYTFYCLANFTEEMVEQAGLTLVNGQITSATLPEDFDTKNVRPQNSATIPEGGIPMSGKLENQKVTITSGTVFTVKDPLILWRMLAKLEFQFKNDNKFPVRVLGIEVEPINLASVENGGVKLLQNDMNQLTNLLPNAQNFRYPEDAKTNVGNYEAKNGNNPLLELPGGQTQRTSYSIYVNETNATITANQNQYSVRFKLQRAQNEQGTAWYDSEFRLGLTTQFETTGTKNGFNIIRRNDWIHIPVTITPWEFHMEVISFPPIGGYAAHVVSPDALSTTFNTGGYITLKPLFRTGPDMPWADLNSADVKFQLGEYTKKNADLQPGDRTTQAITTGNADDLLNGTGLILTGDLVKANVPKEKEEGTENVKMFYDLFQVLGESGLLVANLTNHDNLDGIVTLTLCVRLRNPEADEPAYYYYEFSHNIIKAAKGQEP